MGDALIGSTTTDAAGYYNFNELEPGTAYTLVFEKPDGYARWTTQDAGGDADDSDVNAAGMIEFTTPLSGNNLVGADMADDPTLDAGLIRLVSIGDYVWFDTNRDGDQDSGERVAADIVVKLYLDGELVGETTTDATGFYYFKDLLPNTEYKLVFQKPAGYDWTSMNAGGDAADSDVTLLGEIIFTTPGTGNDLVGPNMTDDPTLDAGLVLTPAEPGSTPVVTELPKTGSGDMGIALTVALGAIAATMMAAMILRKGSHTRA
jgi:hypothetical protein